MSDRRPRAADGRARLGRRRAPAGRRPPSVRLRSRLPARRRGVRDAPRARRPHRPSSMSTSPGCIAPRPDSISPLPADVDDAPRRRRSHALLAADGLDGPDGDASVRITVSRGPFRARGVLPPDEDVAADDRRSRRGPSSRRRPATWSAASTSSRAGVRRDPQNPLATLKTTSRAEYVYARLEARRAGADDALFLTIDDHLSEATSANLFLVRRAPTDGALELATPSLDCAILPGTTRSWLLGWGDAGRPAPGRGAGCDARRPRRGRRGVPVLERGRGPAGDRFEGRPIGDGPPGAWTLRARADREAMIRGDGRRDDPRRADRRTRQLIDEGERLGAQPSLGAAAALAAAVGRPAGHGLGQHGPLPPRVADGRQAARASSAAGR